MDPILAAIDQDLLKLRGYISDETINSPLSYPDLQQPSTSESSSETPNTLTLSLSPPPCPEPLLPTATFEFPSLLPPKAIEPLPPPPPTATVNELLPHTAIVTSEAVSSANNKVSSVLCQSPLSQPHRFGNEVSQEELKELIEQRLPNLTKRNTNWGMPVWRDWCKARNIETLIEIMEPIDINNKMARFIQEASRQDGAEYPPGSLHSVVWSVQRNMRENGRPDVSFFDERNTEYDVLRKSLDARMKDLTRRGIGIQKKQHNLSPRRWNRRYGKLGYSAKTL